MTSKKRMPYIPLYIGDWIQDTDAISIEAEGALLRIIFKCWKGAGVITATESALARICKVDEKKFAAILLEWQQNKILDISQSPNGEITLRSRRVTRDTQISALRAEVGSKGGTKTKANKAAKQAANPEQKPDNDNDNDIVIDNKIVSEERVKREEPVEPDDVFADCERWTEDVLSGNDWMFRDKLRNMNIKPGERLPEFCHTHLALLAQYPRKRPADQNKFRLSLIGHIIEKSKTSNNEFTQRTARTTVSKVIDATTDYSSKL